MKRNVFLKTGLLVCAFFCVFSCSTDANVNETIIEETNAEKTRISATVEALVEFVKGTPERNKMAVRDKYIRMGLLLSWEECEIKDNDDVEVWLIDNIKLVAYGKPNPLNHSEDDGDDVEKITLYANCKDYK